MTKPNKEIRVTVHISDIHSGSDESILQPGFLTEKAQPIGQTPVAEWFYDCWSDFQRWLSGVVNPKEYALIINGFGFLFEFV